MERFDRTHENGSVTRLYIGSNDKDLIFNSKKTNGETLAIKYMTYDEIMRNKDNFKSYVIRSLEILRSNGLI